LQVLDKASRPFRIVAGLSAKGVPASARGEMTDKGVQHPLIDSGYWNAANRSPMPEVRRTAQDKLSGPSSVPSRM
jgi:siroheme synthase